MNQNNTTAVIFIPDISGFSKFVNDIEILHGQEITAELLEEIINSDDLDFEVSEIEGDAILYYKIGDPISIEEIYLQSVKTLQKFHQKKAEVQKKRICQCNACSSVDRLSLKFILHFGDILLINVRQFKKLYGKGVILAHRLLKNNLSELEYILFTKDYPIEIEAISRSFKVIPTEQEIEGIGKIMCNYIKIDLPN